MLNSSNKSNEKNYIYIEIVQYFIFPPIVIIIGMMAWNGFSSIGEKFGDVSYGTYIYGFPIQQLLLHYFQLDVIGLLLVSLPLTLLVIRIFVVALSRKTCFSKKEKYLSSIKKTYSVLSLLKSISLLLMLNKLSRYDVCTRLECNNIFCWC